MPISGNILTHQGIGPIFLYGETSHSPPALPLVILLLMTIVSLLSAVWLVFMTAVFLLSLVADPANELKQRETILALLALLTIAAYFIPISSITFYDRYIMPMIPIGCVFVLLASAPPKYFGGMVWLGPILGCLLAVFSVLGTHDYLSWNRARWQALSYLEGPERQTAHNIDGGFEYNGARLYDPKYVPQARKSFWWVDNDTYKVTFNEIAGEQVIAKFEYLGFMPPGKRYIYVLKGNAGDVMAVSKPDPDGNVQP
jgi:hypothetical protein